MRLPPLEELYKKTYLIERGTRVGSSQVSRNKPRVTPPKPPKRNPETQNSNAEDHRMGLAKETRPII